MSFIENEVAYENAIARNIRLNAAKTRRREWMAMEGAERANAFLFELDEFEPTYREDGRFSALHPVVKASLGDFWTKMRDTVAQYGGLTEKQNAAVLAMIERGEAKVAGYAAKRAAEAAKSNWIGTVGERRMFALSVRHVVTMEGIYGTSYLNIMEDAEGNVVIYKGTKRYEGIVTFKATIKEHGEREGVKQTKIARPA